MSNIPRIAIIGAGPAGLTLARLLHVSHAKFDITVYERDASPTSRPDQGGTLDLHTDTGLAAIRKCNLWDAFLKHARYEGQEFIFCDKNATKLVHTRKLAGFGDRPEIDRAKLRDVLLESMPEGCVKWGRKLREVSVEGKLRFEGIDGVEGPFDLVVGADGAWSKVRGPLDMPKPSYSGVSGFEMEIAKPDETCPHVDKMVGRGSFFGSSDRKFLNGQRMGNNGVKIRTWFMCPEGEAKATLDKLGKQGTVNMLLDRYDGWSPEQLELLRQGDPNALVQWTLYELPVGTKWEHQKGITLIGDAASLATPFAGSGGVNKAMKDSLELGELIERSQDPNESLTLDQAVLQYEQLMFARAEKFQTAGVVNKQNMFAPDAPIGLFTGLLKMKTSESESSVIKMLGSRPFVAMVYSYFRIRQLLGLAARRLWRRT